MFFLDINPKFHLFLYYDLKIFFFDSRSQKNSSKPLFLWQLFFLRKSLLHLYFYFLHRQNPIVKMRFLTKDVFFDKCPQKISSKPFLITFFFIRAEKSLHEYYYKVFFCTIIMMKMNFLSKSTKKSTKKIMTLENFLGDGKYKKTKSTKATFS